MFRLDDTIVAVSSPPGRSPRGLLRLAGPRTLDIVQLLTQATLPCVQRLTAGVLQLQAASGEPPLPLPVFLACWREPAGYTGQDAAEIQCPGHPALLERLVHQMLGLGARLAEPGEFTFRAFMHGKMDLTQAEGVAAIIAAGSHSELAAARHLCAGELGRWSRGLVEELASLLALIEAGIDFTDQEDVVLITPAQALAQLRRILEQVTTLRDNSRSWKQLEALPRLVLAGPPSVGKSTLFNRLLGKDRAVTHEAPGTTRDVLAEPLTLEDQAGRKLEVMLVDVAGVDPFPQGVPQATAGPWLDAQAQQAARQAMAQADLLLVLHSPDEIDKGHSQAVPIGSEGGVFSRDTMASSKPLIHLLAQCDRLEGTVPEHWLPVSALRGDGLEELRRRLAQQVGRRGVSLAGDKLALQPRHEAALAAAISSMRQAQRLLEPQAEAPVLLGLELIAGHLRQALDELACLGGSLSPDEVLGRVFARFCVGK